MAIKHIIAVKRNTAGFTLVEMMVALAVSSILIILIGVAFRSQQQTYLLNEQIATVQQNVRASVFLMTRDIRMAGYDPQGVLGVGVTAASATAVTVSMAANADGYDNNGDGTVDDDSEFGTNPTTDVTTITYALVGTDLQRTVTGPGAVIAAIVALGPENIVSNIERIEFYYELKSGSASRTTAPTSGQRDDIRSVQISILGRTAQPISKATDGGNYQPASGPAGWAAVPIKDGFIRRFATQTVVCRNLGLL